MQLLKLNSGEDSLTQESSVSAENGVLTVIKDSRKILMAVIRLLYITFDFKTRLISYIGLPFR